MTILKKYWKLTCIAIMVLASIASIAGMLEYIKEPMIGYVVKDVRNLQQGDDIVEINIPAFSSRQLKGQTLFKQNCVQCHGENGVGVFGNGPPLIHKIYEPSHHGDQAFIVGVKLGVRQHHWSFGNMPAIDTVSQEDVPFIIDYIRAIQQANGIH